MLKVCLRKSMLWQMRVSTNFRRDSDKDSWRDGRFLIIKLEVKLEIAETVLLARLPDLLYCLRCVILFVSALDASEFSESFDNASHARQLSTGVLSLRRPNAGTRRTSYRHMSTQKCSAIRATLQLSKCLRAYYGGFQTQRWSEDLH